MKDFVLILLGGAVFVLYFGGLYLSTKDLFDAWGKLDKNKKDKKK